MTLLREGLLNGRTVVLAGDVGDEVRSALSSLGASLTELPVGELDDDRAQEWVRGTSPVHGLVAAPVGMGTDERLESALDRTWTAVRAVAAGALIPGGAGGKIVLLAPAPRAGEHAPALRAAIENLARTLSVEWARHAITVAAITPGERTEEAQTGAVVAFLLSPAGDYLSGCRLELGAAGA